MDNSNIDGQQPVHTETKHRHSLWWLGIPVLALVIIGLYVSFRNMPSEDIKAFRSADLSELPTNDWKTYVNDAFDLSLKYPPAMKFNETPQAWGSHSMYAVDLEPTSSTTPFGLRITATTDVSKCSDLVVNDTHMPLSTFVYKKTINGKEFLVNDTLLTTGYGDAFHVFGYVQKTPVCKVAVASLEASTGTSPATRDQVETMQALRTVETVLGSMDTGIRDTGSADTTNMGDSQYALSLKVQEVSSARLAAIRVYSFNSDNTPKIHHSYIGTCEDAAFTSTNPGMTCRESANAYIMYKKIDERHGYACGDTTWYGIVPVEPKGLSCTSLPSATPTASATSNTKSTKIAGGIDCGTGTYSDPVDQSKAFANSVCFNTQFKSCTPANQSGIMNGVTSTEAIVGPQNNECKVTITQTISNSSQSPVVWTCLFDPTEPIPTDPSTIQRLCTVTQ